MLFVHKWILFLHFESSYYKDTAVVYLNTSKINLPILNIHMTKTTDTLYMPELHFQINLRFFLSKMMIFDLISNRLVLIRRYISII